MNKELKTLARIEDLLNSLYETLEGELELL